MTSRDFCYWLQGYFEILAPAMNDQSLSAKQVAVIQNHLRMVFKHEIDPSHGDAKHQEVLQATHEGKYLQESLDLQGDLTISATGVETRINC